MEKNKENNLGYYIDGNELIIKLQQNGKTIEIPFTHQSPKPIKVYEKEPNSPDAAPPAERTAAPPSYMTLGRGGGYVSFPNTRHFTPDKNYVIIPFFPYELDVLESLNNAIYIEEYPNEDYINNSNIKSVIESKFNGKISIDDTNNMLFRLATLYRNVINYLKNGHKDKNDVHGFYNSNIYYNQIFNKLDVLTNKYDPEKDNTYENDPYAPYNYDDVYNTQRNQYSSKPPPLENDYQKHIKEIYDLWRRYYQAYYNAVFVNDYEDDYIDDSENPEKTTDLFNISRIYKKGNGLRNYYFGKPLYLGKFIRVTDENDNIPDKKNLYRRSTYYYKFENGTFISNYKDYYSDYKDAFLHSAVFEQK